VAARFRPRLEALEDRWLPSTLTVTNNLDNGAAGSLRADIAAAQSGDTIVFSNSVGPTITLTGGVLLIDRNLTIQGPGASHLAISGGHVSGVFDVAAGVQATLVGLTIRDGDAETGGGIFSNGTLTVNNCTLSGNYAYRAGAIYSNGTANISGCTLSGNTASGGYPSTILWGGSYLSWYYGGGGGLWNDGIMTVSGSTLSGNVVLSGGAGGGGIYNSGRLTVSSSTITSNSASFAGGGIYNDYYANLTLEHCTVTQNTASYSGADVYNLGYLTIRGSHIGVIGP
jgi:hypothetical protein